MGGGTQIPPDEIDAWQGLGELIPNIRDRAGSLMRANADLERDDDDR